MEKPNNIMGNSEEQINKIEKSIKDRIKKIMGETENCAISKTRKDNILNELKNIETDFHLMKDILSNILLLKEEIQTEDKGEAENINNKEKKAPLCVKSNFTMDTLNEEINKIEQSMEARIEKRTSETETKGELNNARKCNNIQNQLESRKEEIKTGRDEFDETSPPLTPKTSRIINNSKTYSEELESIILSRETEWKLELDKYEHTYSKFVEDNEKHTDYKTCFTYLLLNSKITNNLPAQKNVKEFEAFKIFLNSIFYIGKGTNNRPHVHLREAFKKKPTALTTLDRWLLRPTPLTPPTPPTPSDAKTNEILSSWNEDSGIICLPVFHNVTKREAFSREYAMISAIGLSNLTNIKKSTFNSNLNWTEEEKRQLGCYLLKKAFEIFMIEGERPLFSKDISIDE